MVEALRLDGLATTLKFKMGLFNSSNKIWVLWRDSFAASVLGNSDQYIHLAVTRDRWPHVIYCTFVYAKYTTAERQPLSTDLLTLSQIVGSRPWMVGGDFNVTASIVEYLGPAQQNMGAITVFVDTISTCSLHSVSAFGSRFTWTGICQGRRIWKRLDRVLINMEWLHSFHLSSLQHLNRAGSDHSPLLFQIQRRNPACPWAFKFQHMWVNHPSFHEVLRANWQQEINGYGMFAFSSKLKQLKHMLREWNKNAFGNIFSNVAAAEEEVRISEIRLEEEGSKEARLHWSRAQAQLLKTLADEETYWKQKACVWWLKEGDSNTQFFHSSILAKRALLSIHRIKDINGTLWEDESVIGQSAALFF
ncbi:uncharacterized protein [Coffea arabica]|uniref:Endonuclease/exonuclease/phosphatase domain-containing protein n=1 Tax=Coffea arabica TaxID=13443 RepID=A0A6P6TYP1_COFAR